MALEVCLFFVLGHLQEPNMETQNGNNSLQYNYSSYSRSNSQTCTGMLDATLLHQ